MEKILRHGALQAEYNAEQDAKKKRAMEERLEAAEHAAKEVAQTDCCFHISLVDSSNSCPYIKYPPTTCSVLH